MPLRTSTPTDIAERYWKEHASSVNSCLLNAPKVSYYQTAWTSSREVLKSRNETLNYSIPFVLFLKSLYLSVFLFAVSKDSRDFKLLLLLQDRLIQVSQNRGNMKKFFVLFEWFWSKWAFDADGRQYKQAVWQSVKGNCDRLIEVKISDLRETISGLWQPTAQYRVTAFKTVPLYTGLTVFSSSFLAM